MKLQDWCEWTARSLLLGVELIERVDYMICSVAAISTNEVEQTGGRDLRTLSKITRLVSGREASTPPYGWWI